MPAENLVHIVHGELGQSYDLGLGPDFERQHGENIFFVIGFHDDPRFVLPIHTTPVSVDLKVGAGLKKDLDGPGTFDFVVAVCYLDQIPRHN